MEKVQSLCKQWATPEVSRALLLLPQDMAWLAAPLFTGPPAALPSTTGFIPEGKEHHRTKALKQHYGSYSFPGQFCAGQGTFTSQPQTETHGREKEMREEQQADK